MAKKRKKSPKGSGGKKKRALDSGRTRKDDSEKIISGIPEHKHCYNCGVSIPADRETCSDKCQEEWDRMVKRKKLWTYLPIIGMILVVLFLFLVRANQ